MKLLKFTLLALLSVGIVSCCACRKGSPKIGDLESATWRLIEFNENPIENSQITLKFDGAKKMIYGTAPCNNFFGGYSLFENEKNIQISNIGATRKACPDMEIENAFTQKLSTVTKVKIDGKHLMMINSEGALVALLVAE